MNRIYRIVFNRTLGVPQVVSELASALGGAVVGAVDALPKVGLKSRVLAAAVGMALVTTALPSWAQTCAQTSGTITTSCAGTTSTNGATASGGTGGSPAAPGSGIGGSATAGGNGGAYGGNGGSGKIYSGTYTGGGGGGGGVYGGGGGTGLKGRYTVFGAAGGGGNLALLATGDLNINSGVAVTGGSGGNGGADTSNIFGGGGGGGAAGISFGISNGQILANYGSVSGGSGGTGGNGYLGGGGGGGGMAVNVSGTADSISNAGRITGGNGGAGGNYVNSFTSGGGGAGAGGNGGAGLSITGNSNTITNTNTGSIVGGNGGAGSTVGTGGVGVGISGNSNTLITSGSISGGLDGSGANSADAVDITGGNNTLELDSGYSFTGKVVSTTGNGNILALGASTSDSFDVSSIGAEFTGFDSYAKTGTSTWTLTGTTTAVTPWTISGGTLSVSSDASLGDTSGSFTFNGGTLQFGSSFNLASTRAITLDAGGGTIDTNSYATTISQAMTGSGGLTVTDSAGSGTLTLTGANTYTGSTTINTGGMLALSGTGSIASSSDVIANGTFDISNTISGASIMIMSLGGNGNVTLGTQSLSLTNANDAFYGVISGGGGLSVAGPLEILLGNNTYSGGTTVAINTDLLIGDQGTTGSIVGDVTNNGYLLFDRSDAITYAGVVSGTGQLYQYDATGTLTLTGVSTYTGETVIYGGTLALSGTGSIASSNEMYDAGTFDISNTTNGTSITSLSGNGNVNLGAKTLTLTNANDTFNGVIAGSGGLVVAAGQEVLDGVNTYIGATTVQGGTLLIGDSANPGASIAGDASVENGATLGGYGLVGGNVVVANGAHLAPGSIGGTGTLTVGGNLNVAQGGILDYAFGAPGSGYSTTGTGDLVNVAGNLTLNGATLNVNAEPGFGQGLYTLFNYGGTLTETHGGITFGSVPAGDTLSIQTLTGSGQINLINTGGTALNMWNANGLASPAQMGGGSGTWSVTSTNWTDANGDVTAAMAPQPGFAIFGGAPGTVTVDNSAGAVTAMGLQFATSGYTLTGDTLTLVADASGNAPTIRVGNGTTAGADDVATIDNVLAGLHGLDKSDYGTLILTGNNTYTGGTVISGGTLSVASDANLGDISGALTLDGGMLQVTGTAFNSTTRGITLGAAGGGFDIADAGNTFTVAQSLTGTGALSKQGAGTLVLNGVNTYSGGTTVSAGTLQGNTTSLQGSIEDNASLVFEQAAAGNFAGTVAGSGSLTKSGSGTLTLSGANTYSGGTTIAAGTLQIGNGGTTGMITGEVSDHGVLAFDHSDDVIFGGAISGTGALTQAGSGMLTLTGTDTYTGITQVTSGTLDVEGSLASSVDVASGATLVGNGSLGGITIASGATVSPGSHGVGTLTVNGNVTLAAGSTYQVDATDSGGSDLIHATGTATLGGGSVVSMEAGSNWNPSTTYTILTAGSGVSGTFGGATANFAFLTPTLSYDAHDAYLTLVRNTTTFASVGVTPNEIHTAVAIALSPNNALYNAILPLAVGPARAAFATLAGDSVASTRTAMIDDSQYVRDAINNHLQGVQGTGEVAQQDDQGSVWTSTWGHGGSQDTDGNAAGLSSDGSGVLVGADRDLGLWRLGAVVGSGQLSDNSTDAAADAHSTDTVAGLYTGVDLGAWQWQGGVAHSGYETTSRRQIDVPGLVGSATARDGSGVTQAYVDGGYQFTLAQGSLTPFVDLARVWVHQDAINEGGDVAALEVQANGSSVNDGTAGIRGVFEPSPGLQLHASVGYQHAWGDLPSIDQQQFVNGGNASFTVAGLPVAANAGIVDLGMRFALGRNVSVDASYHGQFASDARDQGARMALNISF